MGYFCFKLDSSIHSFYYSESNGSDYNIIKPFENILLYRHNGSPLGNYTPRVQYANIACTRIGDKCILQMGLGADFDQYKVEERPQLPTDNWIGIYIKMSDLHKMLKMSNYNIISGGGRTPALVGYHLNDLGSINGGFDSMFVGAYTVLSWIDTMTKEPSLMISLEDVFRDFFNYTHQHKISHVNFSLTFIYHISN